MVLPAFMYAYYMYSCCPPKSEEGIWTPRIGSYRQLGATMCVLEIESRSSSRAASALNHQMRFIHMLLTLLFVQSWPGLWEYCSFFKVCGILTVISCGFLIVVLHMRQVAWRLKRKVASCQSCHGRPKDTVLEYGAPNGGKGHWW